MQNPFSPGSTVSISATNTSANAQFPTPNPVSVRVYNAGSATVFIKCAGTSGTAVATTADMPIPAGDVEVFDLTASAGYGGGLWVAAITAASTATVYFTEGQGI